MTRRGVYQKKVGVMVMIPYCMILLLESEGSLCTSAVPTIAPVSRRLERHNRVGDVGVRVSASCKVAAGDIEQVAHIIVP